MLEKLLSFIQINQIRKEQPFSQRKSKKGRKIFLFLLHSRQGTLLAHWAGHKFLLATGKSDCPSLR